MSVIENISEIYFNSEITVYITKEVSDIWNKYKQTDLKKLEANGIIICSMSFDETEVWIKKVTEPKKNDIRKRCYFFMKDKGHQKELDICYRESKGKMFLLGTWHTHPENIPNASRLDKREWIKFAKANKDLTIFCFVIVGINKTKLYIYKEKKMIQLEKGQVND